MWSLKAKRHVAPHTQTLLTWWLVTILADTNLQRPSWRVGCCVARAHKPSTKPEASLDACFSRRMLECFFLGGGGGRRCVRCLTFVAPRPATSVPVVTNSECTGAYVFPVFSVILWSWKACFNLFGVAIAAKTWRCEDGVGEVGHAGQ